MEADTGTHDGGTGAPRRRRVAIACQGGGSHTAFTAGVLRHLLNSPALAPYEIVGLSGTSGGAVCALLAWYPLLDDDAERAGASLDAFWSDNSASTPVEWWLNAWMVWASKLENLVVTPALSPYDSPFAGAALDDFRAMLERQVDFRGIAPRPEAPLLLIGAVDVRSGEFKAFNSRRETITPDMVLASAAIPTLFRAVDIDGAHYWDGLFSQNPPVRELIDAEPDEIWVVQINPRRRATDPRSVVEIADRRNELSGNLSLHQELHFIEKINQLLDDGLLRRDGRYRNIVVRVIELARSPRSLALGAASKLNRDPAFIHALMDHGRARAEEFLTALAFEDAWRSRDTDAVMRLFAEDAELWSAPPFPDQGVHRGRDAIRPFVTAHLTEEIVVDVTSKQVAREQVAWTVRAGRGPARPQVQGCAEADIRGGRVAALRLGPGRADATDRP